MHYLLCFQMPPNWNINTTSGCFREAVAATAAAGAENTARSCSASATVTSPASRPKRNPNTNTNKTMCKPVHLRLTGAGQAPMMLTRAGFAGRRDELSRLSSTTSDTENGLEQLRGSRYTSNAAVRVCLGQSDSCLHGRDTVTVPQIGHGQILLLRQL